MSASFFIQKPIMKYFCKVSWKLVWNVSQILQKTFTNSLNNLKTWHEIFQKCCGIIFRNITVNLSEIFHRKISEMFLCPHHFSFSNILWNISAKFLQNLYEMFLKYCRSLSQSICIIRQFSIKYFSKISWNICGTFLETFYEMFLKYGRKISKSTFFTFKKDS